jgi:hypothetical protein
MNDTRRMTRHFSLFELLMSSVLLLPSSASGRSNNQGGYHASRAVLHINAHGLIFVSTQMTKTEETTTPLSSSSLSSPLEWSIVLEEASSDDANTTLLFVEDQELFFDWNHCDTTTTPCVSSQNSTFIVSLCQEGEETEDDNESCNHQSSGLPNFVLTRTFSITLWQHHHHHQHNHHQILTRRFATLPKMKLSHEVSPVARVTLAANYPALTTADNHVTDMWIFWLLPILFSDYFGWKLWLLSIVALLYNLRDWTSKYRQKRNGRGGDALLNMADSMSVCPQDETWNEPSGHGQLHLLDDIGLHAQHEEVDRPGEGDEDEFDHEKGYGELDDDGEYCGRHEQMADCDDDGVPSQKEKGESDESLPLPGADDEQENGAYDSQYEQMSEQDDDGLQSQQENVYEHHYHESLSLPGADGEQQNGAYDPHHEQMIERDDDSLQSQQEKVNYHHFDQSFSLPRGDDEQQNGAYDAKQNGACGPQHEQMIEQDDDRSQSQHEKVHNHHYDEWFSLPGADDAQQNGAYGPQHEQMIEQDDDRSQSQHEKVHHHHSDESLSPPGADDAQQNGACDPRHEQMINYGEEGLHSQLSQNQNVHYIDNEGLHSQHKESETSSGQCFYPEHPQVDKLGDNRLSLEGEYGNQLDQVGWYQSHDEGGKLGDDGISLQHKERELAHDGLHSCHTDGEKLDDHGLFSQRGQTFEQKDSAMHDELTNDSHPASSLHPKTSDAHNANSVGRIELPTLHEKQEEVVCGHGLNQQEIQAKHLDGMSELKKVLEASVDGSSECNASPTVPRQQPDASGSSIEQQSLGLLANLKRNSSELNESLAPIEIIHQRSPSQLLPLQLDEGNVNRKATSSPRCLAESNENECLRSKGFDTLPAQSQLRSLQTNESTSAGKTMESARSLFETQDSGCKKSATSNTRSSLPVDQLNELPVLQEHAESIKEATAAKGNDESFGGLANQEECNGLAISTNSRLRPCEKKDSIPCTDIKETVVDGIADVPLQVDGNIEILLSTNQNVEQGKNSLNSSSQGTVYTTKTECVFQRHEEAKHAVSNPDPMGTSPAWPPKSPQPRLTGEVLTQFSDGQGFAFPPKTWGDNVFEPTKISHLHQNPIADQPPGVAMGAIGHPETGGTTADFSCNESYVSTLPPSSDYCSATDDGVNLSPREAVCYEKKASLAGGDSRQIIVKQTKHKDEQQSTENYVPVHANATAVNVNDATNENVATKKEGPKMQKLLSRKRNRMTPTRREDDTNQSIVLMPSKKPRPFKHSNIVPDWVPSHGLQNISKEFDEDEISWDVAGLRTTTFSSKKRSASKRKSSDPSKL